MKNNLFDKFTSQLKKEFTKKETFTGSVVRPVSMRADEVPSIVEKKNQEWVLFGEDNLYPQFLKGLLYGSAIHNSIVVGKAKMTAGEGLLINGAVNKEDSDVLYKQLPNEVKLGWDILVNNKYGNDSLPEIIIKLAYDKQLYGAFAYEVVWNTDFTKIAAIKYVDVSCVRSGKVENDKVSYYYYSRDWSNVRGNPPVKMIAFDKTNKESYNQLVYEKDGSLDYYGTPQYIGAINWIKTEMEMAIFHRANIENGMNPGLHFKFYKLPDSQNQEDEIIRGIESTWGGAKKAGKKIVTFNDGKETAMDVEPVEVSNLDKQLLLLAELCDQKILTGHGVTSPLLFGISTAGQLGGNTELKVAYNIFDNEVIAYDRHKISMSLQRNVIDINGLPIKIEINPFDPFREREVVKSKGNAADALNTLSPLVATKVLETMTNNEIRALAGLPPVAETPTNTTPTQNG